MLNAEQRQLLELRPGVLEAALTRANRQIDALRQIVNTLRAGMEAGEKLNTREVLILSILERLVEGDNEG